MADKSELSFVATISAPTRLDVLIKDFLLTTDQFGTYTRSQCKLLIEKGAVEVSGKIIKKAGELVKPNSSIKLSISPASPSDLSPYEIELRIIHEDDAIIVIDKPPFLTMHPGAGNSEKTLLNALVSYYQKTAPKKPTHPDLPRAGIVHRLDKDTSGVIVVAKTLAAHQELSKAFAKRAITRRYMALVLCSPRRRMLAQGSIRTSIGRHPVKRTKMSVLEGKGKASVTHWHVLEEMQYAALLEIRLETGRTHQIRVHLDSIGHPVIGDQTYGDFSLLPERLMIASQKFGRQALHAFSLKFLHPETRQEMAFETKPPDDFELLLRAFR